MTGERFGYNISQEHAVSNNYNNGKATSTSEHQAMNEQRTPFKMNNGLFISFFIPVFHHTPPISSIFIAFPFIRSLFYYFFHLLYASDIPVFFFTDVILYLFLRLSF
jgi:hypothetical protein